MPVDFPCCRTVCSFLPQLVQFSQLALVTGLVTEICYMSPQPWVGKVKRHIFSPSLIPEGEKFCPLAKAFDIVADTVLGLKWLVLSPHNCSGERAVTR